jgi:HK97 gp10 family phage protein
MKTRQGFAALKAAVARAAPVAVHDAATLVAAEVRRNAPEETGRLAGSVEVVQDPPEKAYASASVEVTGGHEPQEIVGNIEFGTAHMVANPFIRRSFASTKGRAIGVVKATMRSAIGKSPKS